MAISLIFIDDHPLFRKGLMHLLQDHPEFRAVGQFADLASARDWLAQGGRADIALLDRTLGETDGMDLIPDLKAQGIKVIMLTVAEEDYEIRIAIERGVDGYVLKSSEPEHILRAIHAVHQGNTMLPAGVLQKITRGEFGQGVFDKLSQREFEIVTYVARGLTNRAIGEALGLAENTVRNHLRNILDKLGLENRVQVATLALAEGAVKKDR
ncbi:MAG TPA: DNA-binding response regulator [Betaproteobacteria bacterium]|nr:DNA-binding response regulator [Betaproteobacteria bacterium]